MLKTLFLKKAVNGDFFRGYFFIIQEKNQARSSGATAAYFFAFCLSDYRSYRRYVYNTVVCIVLFYGGSRNVVALLCYNGNDCCCNGNFWQCV